MRRVLVFGGLLWACSVANPAFDAERPLADGSDDGNASSSNDDAKPPGTSDPATSTSTSGEGEGDDATDTSTPSDGSSDEGSSGRPPERVCPFEPSPGLSLAFGDPAQLGGSCPTGVSVVAQLSVVEGELVAAACAPDCTSCRGAHPVQADPLTLTDHVLVGADVCVVIEAAAPLGEKAMRCHWGALTILDFETNAPYLIATAELNDPTAAGAEILGEAIPDPAKAVSCACTSLANVDACCEEGKAPPEFMKYAIAGMDLLPGDSAPLEVPNSIGLIHTLTIHQAQSIPTCDGHMPRTSWAVAAEL